MYRKCVAVVVFDQATRLCLVGKRAGTKDGWQFPQGGVDEGETHEQAAKRELFEEMGVRGCVVSPNNNTSRQNVSVSVCCVADIGHASATYAKTYACSEKSYMPSAQFIKRAGPFKYDYPAFVKRKEKGQEVVWFLAAKSSKIDVLLNEEFSDHTWMAPDVVMKYVVDFKKESYNQALKGLGLI